ncbi:MAG: family major facilitator transporter [Paenibacillaceae bacterium]|jgi:EmrB/QacA subfamily drug resistance transporter|nr:family major facilitator transporter [Paenibacillaceae bacterium]
MDRKKSNIRLTVAGLMLGLLLAALDQTIVSTAMPTIVSVLGGLDKYVWVFSAYLITSVTSMPIFGKLSDMYGRKLFFLIGLTVFMIGSALCGTANGMTELIIYRAIQGIGGGALMPITFTIVFDIFPREQQGKMQGLFGAVFGVSSVLGPLAGAFFTDYVDWRWIFYINLPLGVVSFILIVIAYHESLEHRRQKIDWWGTIVMTLSVLALMFALELGGKTVDGVSYAWDSWRIIGLFVMAAVLLIVFLIVETKVSDPVVPLNLFRKRLFAASMGTSFFYGMTLICAATYIPLFIQGVKDGTASNSGLVLTPMMLGVVASSAVGGMLTRKFPYRNVMLVSVAILLIGTAFLAKIDAGTSRILITVYMILMGFGVGASFPVLAMSSLHNMEYRYRGSVNSILAFFRTIGSTIGIAVFGSLQMNHFSGLLETVLPDPQMLQKFGADARVLLQPEVKAHIPQEVVAAMSGALADSIASVFAWLLAAIVLGAAMIVLMGKAKLEFGGSEGRAQGSGSGTGSGSGQDNGQESVDAN